MLLRHPVLSLATFAYLGIVAWVTLGPQPLDSAGRAGLRRVIRWLQATDATAWVTYEGVEFTANILMFLPIGLLFVLLLGRRLWSLAVLFGVALSVGIEAAQIVLPERVPDARDLLSNSLGAIIGVVAALVVTWPKAHAIRRRQRAVKGDPAQG